MARLKKISSEFGALCVLMALAQAGWHTSISAATIHRTLASVATWIHYSIDALFGFAVLSFALLILPAIFSLFIKVKPGEDENRAIRRFLLAGAIGLGLAVVFPLVNTDAVVQLLPDQTGYRMAIIIFGLIIFSLVAGAVISNGVWSMIERKPAGYQWRFFWAWWFFMVTAPPIGMAIKDKLPIDNIPIKIILIILVAAFFLYVAIKLVPKLINSLNRSGFAAWGIVFICSLLVFYFTLPPKPKIQKGLPATVDTPPIILITVDTLRTDALDCYPEKKCLRVGASNIDRLGSPTIDYLADSGTLFENAYSTSPWTLPSVASILTGLPPTAHGAIDEKNQGIGRGATNLAEILKASGWATGAVVVNPILLPKSGLGDGFDYYDEIYSELGRSGKLPFQRLEYKIRTKTLGHHDLTDNYVQEHLAIKRALQFIYQHKDERFFLWLHLFAPHAPYYPIEIYRLEAERNFNVKFKVSELVTNAGLNSGLEPIDPDRLKRILALYWGEVKFTDSNIGFFLQMVDDLVYFNQCLVILSADHGEEFYDHDRIAHGHTLFPELVQVPLIMRWPGRIPEGKRISENVSLTDIAPTILDLVGVEPAFNSQPAIFTGRSLVPAIEDKGLVPMPIFFEEPILWDRGLKGVISDNYFYVGGPNIVLKPKLYDLSADPNDLYDVTDEMPEKAKEMEAIIEDYNTLCLQIAKQIGSYGGTWDSEALRALGYVN